MASEIDIYYRQFAPMVHRRCKKLLSDEDEALDAMQEVFVKLMELEEEVRAPSSLLPSLTPGSGHAKRLAR